MEILAPVRSLETLKIAILTNANAVYFAGYSFSAREKAHITEHEFAEMVKLCRLCNVKSYITVNTLIYNDQLHEFIEYLKQLYLLGCDAFIVQNVGLIPFIKQYFPEIEVHASTQMHISNISAGLLVKELGCDRIVLPREFTFEQIKNFKDTVKLPIEVFAHGALCVSYSGQCFASSLVGGRSANKGSCAQMCRKEYRLLSKQKIQKSYPVLNLKDLQTTHLINNFKDANVDSLKIEGRLKSLDYIMVATEYYSSLVNGTITDFTLEDLSRVYNRDFTSGMIDNKPSAENFNLDRVNHNGLLVGYVINQNENYVTIELSKPLHRLDHIRFVSDTFEDGIVCDRLFIDNQPTESVESGLVKVFVRKKIPINAKVYCVKSNKLQAHIKSRLNCKEPHRLIELEMFGKVGDKLTVNVLLGDETYAFQTHEVIAKALKSPVTLERVCEQLSKVQDTHFKFNFIKTDYESGFIAIKQISDLKTTIVNFLYKHFLKQRTLSVPQLESCINICESNNSKRPQITFQVNTVSQANYLIDLPDTKVYVNDLRNLDAIKLTLDKTNHEVIPVLPNVIKNETIFYEIISLVANYDTVMVSELGFLNYFKDKKRVITNFTCYCTNIIDQSLFKELNVTQITLPIEASVQQLDCFDYKSEIIVYGTVQAMSLNNCPINKTKIGDCGNCTICQDERYYLENEFNDKFMIKYLGFNNLALLSHKPINRIKELELSKKNIDFYRIIIEDESKDELMSIINSILEIKK